MSSRCLESLLLLLAATAVHAADLRVCAEPDNLPFSHENESGFENRIARLVADDLGMTLRYSWQPQRRGFVRKTLGAGLCDVWMGVPSDFERLLPTKPYYRSTYVFVYRDRPLQSFDDERLRELRLGVQLPADGSAATPPGVALALRGAAEKVVGYPVYGEQPAAQRIVDAVARGELDAGVVWGPAAGLPAARRKLTVAAASAPAELTSLPFAFAISMGVKNGDAELRDRLNAVIERRKAEIDSILTDYAVPLAR
jgi:mxaJ protein